MILTYSIDNSHTMQNVKLQWSWTPNIVDSTQQRTPLVLVHYPATQNSRILGMIMNGTMPGILTRSLQIVGTVCMMVALAWQTWGQAFWINLENNRILNLNSELIRLGKLERGSGIL